MRYPTCALLLALVCSACSSGDDDDAATAGSGAGGHSGAGGTGGSGGNGGSSGGGAGAGGAPIEGPAIDSAPAEWARPADCGGIGDLCVALGCGARSTCQLIGDVCIPAFAAGSSALPSKSADHPYCAAFTCMTFEEASCFCTGPAGDTQPACSSPEALAGLCVGPGSDCSEEACCDGLSCVSDGYSGRVCEQTCASGDECETGCCTDLRDTGDMICAEQSACDNPCKKRGEACMGSETSNGGCCRGSCVESTNSDFAGCRPTCNVNEDCDTGCCQLFDQSTYGFCADARYCVCGQMDAACGGMNAQCCDGFECVGASVETLACHEVCTGPADCATHCCAPVNGADYMVCEPPEYCP
jgi:hypothetical protein